MVDASGEVLVVANQYAGGSDKWLDPYAKEHKPGSTNGGFLPVADMTSAGRPQWQTWAFDWLGNITDTDDNAHAFWDRSIGKQEHNPSKKYQLQSANNTGRTGGRNGTVAVNYDSAGYMTQVRMTRAGPCLPVGGLCKYHQYNYYWDEVGNLVRAKRFLNATDTPDTTASQVNMDFAYDASGQRVRKSLWSSHTVYVFPSLELRWTTWNEVDKRFEVTNATESTYLIANGVKLGRVAHAQGPTATRGSRVFLELGDHLGSTAVVLDYATGELVERSTSYAYGATESDYRPERWEEFREPYKFTGKEEDIELGITYFGKRYYSPYLGRWLSADPLAVHEPREADLNLYAYVHGRVFVAVDPVGLEDKNKTPAPAAGVQPPTPPPPGSVTEAQEIVRYGGGTPSETLAASAYAAGVAWAKKTYPYTAPVSPPDVASELAKQFKIADPALRSYIQGWFNIGAGLTSMALSAEDMARCNRVAWQAGLHDTNLQEGWQPSGNGNWIQMEAHWAEARAVAGAAVGGAMLASGMRALQETTWKASNSNGGGGSGQSPDPRASSPIDIPDTVVPEVQPKTGYQQIRYRWSDNGYKYEARWHTGTPGAPADQGNTWVITRRTPGTPSGQQAVEHVLTGPGQWTPMHQWKAAVHAQQQGTATAAQKALLAAGHWVAP